MGYCGYGIVDGVKGPLGENLHVKDMRGVLLKKGGVAEWPAEAEVVVTDGCWAATI